ncbi:ATP12, ATPase F1F0-assembly protein [Corchorus capsularis]|uniref:ATP12, ATPase F1F0-assembly protein n=1 Tax=Corchorus capsularis TaxID=210143 RepID=A0A1R3GN37_COCAP|nr:ATP12, ATPase F1F0-assembly protein [Corchorus capsularis]
MVFFSCDLSILCKSDKSGKPVSSNGTDAAIIASFGGSTSLSANGLPLGQNDFLLSRLPPLKVFVLVYFFQIGIDAFAAAGHSLVIALGIFRRKLQIEEAIEFIRLEEDLQVDKWGMVEGVHDVDIADLKVQISSATVFLALSRRNSFSD